MTITNYLLLYNYLVDKNLGKAVPSLRYFLYNEDYNSSFLAFFKNKYDV